MVALTADNIDCTSMYTGVNVNWRHQVVRDRHHKVTVRLITLKCHIDYANKFVKVIIVNIFIIPVLSKDNSSILLYPFHSSVRPKNFLSYELCLHLKS